VFLVLTLIAPAVSYFLPRYPIWRANCFPAAALDDWDKEMLLHLVQKAARWALVEDQIVELAGHPE
jgi:hypothetical protein